MAGRVMASTIVVIPLRHKGQDLLAKNEDHQVWFHTVGTSQDKTNSCMKTRTILNVFHTLSTSEDERFAFLTISDRGKGFDGVALFYRDKNSGNKTFLPIVATPGKFQYNVVDIIGVK